jgi:hypothetical protein
MTQIVRHCRDCGWDRPFEQHHDQPGECPDSPDGECPEWSCTACGTALLIAVAVPVGYEPARAAEPRTRVA